MKVLKHELIKHFDLLLQICLTFLYSSIIPFISVDFTVFPLLILSSFVYLFS